MNKQDLIAHVADEAKLSKSEAERALNAVISGVTTTLAAGGTVALTGFGAFSVTKRAARVSRNPQNGEAIQVPESLAPKFKPGSNLKAAVA
ncbi:DNA-binding protein hu-beta, transcriptional regulator subunit beta [Cupriavidus basilensis OR16]|uniref:DNA-binding protein hu-beta, transcriptional regulator subunit beta n=1 Tax=Cupriavidus basilensis OR16 TaxID=1127483 RepID=H1SDL9_9BURK|nr:HU family DNA-binding protein [Cupriavidus basilensis]EHP39404.1 DNA-binding protein hu-beta, transcriptional regulator subunit beta [Cupriavidus basilensis OR16]